MTTSESEGQENVNPNAVYRRDSLWGVAVNLMHKTFKKQIYNAYDSMFQID